MRRSSVPVTVILSKTMCAPLRRPCRVGAAGFEVAVVLGDGGAHGFEASDVEVDGAAADGAASGHGDAGDAGAGDERAEDEGAGAHGLDDLVLGDGVGEDAALDAGAVLGAAVA